MLSWSLDVLQRGTSFRRSVLKKSGSLRKRFAYNLDDSSRLSTRGSPYKHSSLRPIEDSTANEVSCGGDPSSSGTGIDRLMLFNPVGFRQRKQNPVIYKACTKTDDATAELERIVNKKDFFQMDIVGQFNLGFIMTTLAGQLFIIDQHAADEITTFERLCKNHAPQRQPLLLPKKLEMSPAEAAILPEYLEPLERIGFCIEDGHLCRAPSVAGKKGLAKQQKLFSPPF